jgi:adenylosuccinate synthase
MELIVVGCQSGDEGKGKITDALSEGAYAVARYLSGPNTGHTVVTSQGEFRFIQVPAGAVRGAIGVLGNGCVIDPRKLLDEIHALEQRGVKVSLRISESAHVILPYHGLQDEALERWRGEALATSAETGFRTGAGMLGSTKTGVGPCREDKIARIGLRMIDLLDLDLLRARLRKLLPLKRALIEATLGAPAESIGWALSAEPLAEAYHRYGLALRRYLCDVSAFLARARAEGRYVVYEGAQSLGLDVEHGTYPYVSSGYSGATGVTVGTGSPPGAAFEVVGVAKAYMVQVGGGPLPTEIFGDTADYLVARGREIGTVTGRRRRVGWFDLPFVRRAVRIDGVRRLCLTNIDVLAGLPEVRVATHYQIDGEPVHEFPSSLRALAAIQPVYQSFEGWPEQDWAAVAAGGLEALPAAARRYIDFLCEAVGVPLGAVSVGRLREQTIHLFTPQRKEVARAC